MADSSNDGGSAQNSQNNYGIFFTSDDQNYGVLYTGNVKEENCLLVQETRKKGLIDTACSSTVSGERWIDDFVDSMSEESRANIEKYDSVKVFKFGAGDRKVFKGFWRIPCCIAGENVYLETDVIEADIPCLISKPALKGAKATLKLETD